MKKPDEEHIRNVALDLVLGILTIGLWNLVVQYKQIKALNSMLSLNKYSFGMWFVLCLITLSLYHVYHEYRKADDLNNILNRSGGAEPIIIAIMTFLGLSLICDAVMQSQINKHFGTSAL